ncbi:hypothetical protein Bca52824_070357 [Brassica carinata]|uniref:Replication factor-A protein 1 N-terminal domain-containing protein n=1 Tax=Brassica carinata TaxID=52824 RepID=A0A8X7PCC7_BRACI|nr:hypothetical protein Bca52824_088353 [Brassica carinata]KAG2263278.1 hypothetical protein Bca52824_070357 [Brassica carinata]
MYFGYGFEEYSDYQETVKNHEDMQPVLQVTELNLITAQQEPLKERIRVLLSVGTAFVQAKLGVTLNPLVKDEILQSGSILDHFVCSEIQKKKDCCSWRNWKVIKTSSYIIGDHVRAPRKASDQHGGETLQHGRSDLSGGRKVNNTEIGTSQCVRREDNFSLKLSTAKPLNRPETFLCSNPYTSFSALAMSA